MAAIARLGKRLGRSFDSQPGGQNIATHLYNALGRRTTMMLGAGSTRQYQFDARSQLTTQIELSGATPICTIVDGYDPVGNRVTRNLDGVPVTWSYDDLYRLTGQLKAGQVCTYSLDGVGNLMMMWEGGSFPRTFTFDAADRLVTMAEGANLTTYAWTKFGAMESETTGVKKTTYAYSGQDQLIGVTPPSGFPSTYSFDGDGLRRTAQEGNALPTTMVWDGSDYLLLRGPTTDQVVLSLDSEIVASGDKDLLTDPLGTLVKEITAGAHLSGLFQFHPYGSLAGPNPLTANPFRYGAVHGYYTDNTHRDYIRARELEKKLGRWMQVDPLWPGEPAYIYADSGPASLNDPSGEAPKRKCRLHFRCSDPPIHLCLLCLEEFVHGKWTTITCYSAGSGGHGGSIPKGCWCFTARWVDKSADSPAWGQGKVCMPLRPCPKDEGRMRRDNPGRRFHPGSFCLHGGADVNGFESGGCITTTDRNIGDLRKRLRNCSNLRASCFELEVS